MLFSAPDQGLDVQLTCRARPPLPRPSRRSGVETETGDPGTPPRYSQLVVRTPNTRFPSPPRPISPMRKRAGGQDAGCLAADGQVWTFDRADANPLEHPNCTKSFGPHVPPFVREPTLDA